MNKKKGSSFLIVTIILTVMSIILATTFTVVNKYNLMIIKKEANLRQSYNVTYGDYGVNDYIDENEKGE